MFSQVEVERSNQGLCEDKGKVLRLVWLEINSLIQSYVQLKSICL